LPSLKKIGRDTVAIFYIVAIPGILYLYVEYCTYRGRYAHGREAVRQKGGTREINFHSVYVVYINIYI
jgi:hypothetical protein